MISLLMPSRNRPENFRRFLSGAMETAGGPFELVVRLDSDEPQPHAYESIVREFEALSLVTFLQGPRTILSDCWTDAARVARGDIFWLQDDEVTFTSDDWVPAIERFFAEHGPYVVGGADEGAGEGHFCCPILSREWVELTGHTYPLGFDGDFGDCWIRDVALGLPGHRYRCVGATIKQLAAASGLAPKDATFTERQTRQREQNISQLFASREWERTKEIALLTAEIIASAKLS